jgi:cytosine/adenosine deaminase-related metal-dependent hydrolase
MTPRILHADAVLPGDGPPIVDAAVVVEGDRVTDVGEASQVLPRHAGAPVERIAGVVFPGLVNAHTHVELSALRGHVPGGAGFVRWVDRFVGIRHQLAFEDEAEGIERGVRELVAACTRAVGDVSNALSAVFALVKANIGGIVFHEVFGVPRDPTLARALRLEAEREERIGPWKAKDLAYAPAPHTLYTTHPDAVRALVEKARAQGVRTTIHLAEHPAERMALERGEGAMVDWLALRLGLDRATLSFPHMSPVAFAESLGLLAPDVLLVHLTDARPEELDRIAASGAHAVLCPRSNLYIETKLPPLIAMRAAGIAPALGTDSLASNTSLDVLAEAKALSERFPQVPAYELVQMATWNGARALGRPELGRIARGARPGLVATDTPLPPGVDPATHLLRNLGAKRRWVVRAAPNDDDRAETA